ncbi:IS110 family transposase [Clostridium sp. BJN0013]|jgi:transposase|uniref:IS110 family transposase n=1 Tax=Clostridium sp. BJN0013 TaxID=3236840 RepID=UPI0034C6A5E1
MSKFFNLPVVGIDVSADYSMVAILAPDGAVYRKAFKIMHTSDGFSYLLKEMRKVEKEFSMKPSLFMESTGVYHLTLFHFLKNNELETFVINPLITNSNKNLGIRKVKNDKMDALTIANIAKFQNIKMSDYLDIPIFAVRSLCRDYYSLIDNRSQFKKKLSSDLRTFFPGYHNVFSDVAGVTSLAVLSKFSSPKAIVDAPKDDLIALLKENSCKSIDWCTNTYNKLLNAALSAVQIGITNNSFKVTIGINIKLLNIINEQIETLVNEIESAVKNDSTPASFKNNIALLLSFKGIGFITAVTIMSEIGDPTRFKHPKEMVAFFGIDPSVSQSGKFNSDQNKMSKRGTRFGRRALYAAALASIRKSKTGKPINSVLYQYRNKNLNGKKKKVALCAIMHKLVKYIFAVLRDQKPYEIREPKLHNQMYVTNFSRSVS